MSDLFLAIVNMSISASWIVLAVLLLRWVLKKAPKWISVLLWGIVAVRLICPFSVESVMSLIPSAETITKVPDAPRPHFESGVTVIDDQVNEYLGGHYYEGITRPAGHFADVTTVLAIVWLVGIALLLAYTIVSYLRVKNKIGTAVLLRDNIYQSENVVSPFVLGIIRPKIYLPFNMKEQDMEHVVAHEQAHICRKDHLWKPLGFLILALHWFNPLVWLGYVLLCRDIELACDEKVVKKLSREQKADYSQALLTCSVNRRIITACPLAFGEVGVKNRVKSVLNYKKPAFWIILVAIVASVVVAVCFLTNPESRVEGLGKQKDSSELKGLSLEIVAVESSAPDPYITVEYKNGTDNELIYGDDHHIYKKVGTAWEDCSVYAASVWNSVAYMLEAKGTSSHVYGLNGKSMSEAGKYRFETDLFVKGEPDVKYKAWIEFELKEGIDGAGVLSFKPCEIVYSDGRYSYVQTVESAPGYMLVNGMQLIEIYDGKASDPLGVLEEMTLSEENFDLRFNSISDYCWLGSQTLESLKKDNERTWQLQADVGGETSPLYILLEQKDKTFYLGYGYYNCNSNEPKNHDDSHIRWLYRLESVSESELGIASEPAENTQTTDVEKLREKYPQFFNVSTDGGLTVYIWQMSKDSRYCHLANTSMEALSDNSFAFEVGATIPEMRAILTTYDIERKDITVQPVKNPLSSYYYEIDDEYREMISELFWKDEETFESRVSYANWSDDGKIYTEALNTEKMYVDSVQHLPVYKFDTIKDLEQFKQSFGNTYTFDSGWDEVPSFNSATSRYDKAFFEENSLILIYVGVGNSTHRFKVQNVAYDDSSFCVHVTETTKAEVVDSAMAGWFITVAVSDGLLENVKSFDADLNNEIKLYDGSKLPKLKVYCGKRSEDAVMGTATWFYEREDGAAEGICADADHPKNRIDYLLSRALEVDRSEGKPLSVRLVFDAVPDSLRAEAFTFDENGNIKSFEPRLSSSDGPCIILNEGEESCVYEVIAEWNSKKEYYGTVRYSFCVAEAEE